MRASTSALLRSTAAAVSPPSAFSAAKAAARFRRAASTLAASASRRCSHWSLASADARFRPSSPSCAFSAARRASAAPRASPSPFIRSISVSRTLTAPSSADHFSAIARPSSEYLDVSDSFSRIAAFSSTLPKRNLVNWPCARIVVRQNCAKSSPVALRAISSHSLTSDRSIPPGERSRHVQDASLSFPLFSPRERASTDHFAS